MKKFRNCDLLLETDTARHLYHDHAAGLPIIDCRSNLSVEDICENKRFSNITELWLYSDPFIWQAMRSCGADEKYITGDGSDYEKFREYCRIMPLLVGNPLYIWSHIELYRLFGCELIINEDSCDDIWELTSDRLAKNSFGIRDHISSSNIKLLCCAADPCDDLHYFEAIRSSGYEVQVLPTFCPDKGFNIGKKGICSYIKALEESTGKVITDYDSLTEAYLVSLDRFEALGCQTADLGSDNYIAFARPDKYHANEVFKKALSNDGEGITENELALWKTQLMRFFGLEYVKRGWVLRLHCGVLRSQNRIVSKKDGFRMELDAIYGNCHISEIAELLYYMKETQALPKTVIYTTDPSDNPSAATLCRSFCQGDKDGIPTVVQGGSLDFGGDAETIKAEMKNMASLSSIGCSLGMLAECKSLMIYPRQEYFRRVLCDLIGGFVEKGLYPDLKNAEKTVERISYYNAVSYFGFDIK